MVDLIEKKRDGLSLTKQEIDFIIQGYTDDTIPDYQMAAFAMAVYFQGMTINERADLTMAMVNSGETIDLAEIEGVKVDKHSTGGVGDTTTLVLGPLVAAAGVPVAKMSGRGLGHTGGTIDKLESIAGFSVELEKETFIRLVNQNKLALIGQSANLTPADKKLYGLRDVTATVNSIPLIASSIMSKKIASGADAIVLDVKTGSGAFMKEIEAARELARAMVDIGNELGRNTMAVISDMNQPLGMAIGNALEVKEAIDTLRGEGPKDLVELCLTLGSHMVFLAKKADSPEQARVLLEEILQSGKALETLRTFIVSQGGDPSVVDHPERLPIALYQIDVVSPQKGYICAIEADTIGIATMKLGAGRLTKEDSIDLAVGTMLHKKIGDYVEAGEAIATVHSNQQEATEVVAMIQSGFSFSDEPVSPPTFIYDQIR